MRANEVSAEQIKGRHVIDRAGNELGDVEDVTFDPTALRVTGFIVRMNKQSAERLQLSAPLLGSARIEVGADRLGSIGDTVLLNIDEREMVGMLYDAGRGV